MTPTFSLIHKKASTGFRLALIGLWAWSTATAAISVGTSLPQGVVGQTYNTVLSPTGGTAPYTHVVSSGALPPGLNLATNGTISGTPTAGGQYSFSVQSTDSLNATGVTNLTLLTTNISGLIISTTTLPAGRVNTPYDFTVAAQGGTAPYSFDLLLGGGSLPPGLTMSATGRISGTPTTGGVFPVIVRVTDAGGNSFQSPLSLRIDAASLTITTTSLVGGSSNVPYTQTIAAVGGTPPYTFSVIAGNLPPGLSLAASTGILSGTPTSAGTYNFFVLVTDSAGVTAQASYSVVVAAGSPRIVTSALPNGIVNQAFSGAFLAQGGTAPYTFNTVSGNLPPGLTLSPTGAIFGTPTAAGVYPLTVRVTDSAAQSTQADVFINVNSSAFSISTVTPAEAFVNAPYNLALVTTGGNGAVAFTQQSGTLPPGLSLAVNGVISGVPTTAGIYNFVVRALDSAANTAQLPITVKVNSSTLLISQAGLANGTINVPYSSTLSASNGTPPYTFSVSGSQLPPGLTLANNGNVSGTPTAGGLFQTIFRVTDSVGATATQTVPIYIAATGLNITTLTLPSANQNQPYANVLQAAGGTTPYTFALSSGNLPDGVTLSPSGLLSGTPTQAAGTYLFTVRVTDGAGGTSFVTYNFNINNSNLQLSFTEPNPAQIGNPYTLTLAASGGSGAVTFVLSNGSLPPGLTLAPNGSVTGTPTAAGVYLFTVRATDAVSNTALFSRVISVASSQLAISATPLPDIISGTQYQATLAAVGGLPPYTFSLASGLLPPGITLNPNGNLSGVATSIGAYSVTFRVTDANGATSTSTRTLNVLATAGLSISTTALPTARRTQAYSATLLATGGTAPYTFSLGAGSALPTGLTLSSAGVITGTPTQDGTTTFVVRAQDALAASTQRTLSLTVTSSTLNITNDTIPAATVNALYTTTLLATGGSAPYTFASVGGNLPPGLTLSSTGVLSGTPTTAGSYPIVIGVTDASGAQIQRSYVLQASTSGLAITNVSLPAVFVGQNYRATLQATGGVTPFTFSVASGTLPAGLTLAPATGVISGTPTTAGQSTVTFRVQDNSGATAQSTYVLGSSQSTISFGSTTIPNPSVGVPFTFSFSGTGGASPYTFTALSGLPPGLTLSTAGALTGTPTQDGSFTVLVRATDANGAVVESNFPITVLAAGFRFTTTSLPNAPVNQAYSQAIATTGATGNVTYSLQSGSLPQGLTLAPTGLISGTAIATGTSNFVVRAVDSANVTITSPFTLTVGNPSVSITTNTLPSGTINQTYNQTLAASGGTGPYAFTLNSGTLPTGLTLSSSGAISGTPTATGTFTFNVRVTDGGNQTSTADFLIGIGAVGAPNLLAAVSAANYSGNGVAPGEIVLIYGTNMGPATLQSFTVVNNTVATSLAGTRVLFDGTPAPVIYTSANQVAVVAPFNLTGKTSTRVVVEMFGAQSATVQIPVRTTKPSIFTQDSSGNGAGSIVNQDGTVNTATVPADRQSIVSIYVTGVGQMNPASQDGVVTNTLSTLVTPVTVLINGQPAEVLYQGNAPGLVPGVAQLNVRIPAGAVSGANTIRLTSGGNISTGNVTVFVR